MTAALAASRERQRQLIADAGHELRTPLTSLRTNIDLLLRAEATGRNLPPDARRTLLTGVKAQMRELSSLVGDLLELARPADARPARETVALHDVAARAVARARLRGPGLTVESRADPWYVHGDPASLERAVVNLLDNAVKFSPPGGTVTVRLAGGELTVRDCGPGIPAEDLPHVFERFWRSPSARSLPGSGLGLSIVARVVAETGGRVTLEPAPGGGTLARVRLPGTPAPPD
jgi:two-component system sensor histidine kinase MprB